MAYRLYGIPNCDTVKKARKWLDEKGVNYEFHNYKTEGIDKNKIENWTEQVELKVILNKASTTFRALSDEEKASADDKVKAIELMQTNPSMIKRPVFEKDGKVLRVGFRERTYDDVL
ncbi:arsenate reductase [Marinilongibacter aquaticus]|uniref:arsenate reductase n=1 Tax=Marinilongibacter aquaticus TaxID=2975157 RepID=UPI0021BD0EA6|nr:arsenate reductase [Marinilongibacter aquaticus]UBM60877.1 arsenate reductase [Marinilongibacter aquaticus]